MPDGSGRYLFPVAVGRPVEHEVASRPSAGAPDGRARMEKKWALAWVHGNQSNDAENVADALLATPANYVGDLPKRLAAAEARWDALMGEAVHYSERDVHSIAYSREGLLVPVEAYNERANQAFAFAAAVKLLQQALGEQNARVARPEEERDRERALARERQVREAVDEASRREP